MNADILEMAKAFSLEKLLTPEELAEYYKSHPERKPAEVRSQEI